MTPATAPYKLRQRLSAMSRLLASSAELREYQREHKLSALEMAKRVQAHLANQNP